ncbi:bactofilin family protein [Zavarzinia sp.]|uniref:bactofilin family protein n=1 Tax=Zavarzinia sp. TaxID=2027920 RepID=UPI003BB5EC0F
MFNNRQNKRETKPGNSGRRGENATRPSILAEGLSIEGNIETVGDLQIDGTVTGDITCRSLTLGEDGLVKGAINAETVHIRGRIEGRIDAAVVELAASAVISGDILHDSIGVEAGANIEGQLKRRHKTRAATEDKPAEGGKPALVVTNS